MLLAEAATLVTPPPAELVVAAGERVSLPCIARGYPPPVVTWTYNGEPVNRQIKSIIFRLEIFFRK